MVHPHTLLHNAPRGVRLPLSDRTRRGSHARCNRAEIPANCFPFFTDPGPPLVATFAPTSRTFRLKIFAHAEIAQGYKRHHTTKDNPRIRPAKSAHQRPTH